MPLILTELTHSLKVILRTRYFALLIVAALGIGIGGSAAIFGLIYRVLLEPLPYVDSNRLFVVREVIPEMSSISPSVPANPEHFDVWRRSCSAFEEMAAFQPFKYNLQMDNVTSQVNVVRTSATLFPILGVQPEIGRLFNISEETPGNDRVVILSDAFWRRKFNADPNILGRGILLDNASYTVIGVLPSTFWFPKGGELGSFVPLADETDMFKPLGINLGTARPGGNFSWAVIAKLKRKTSPEVAEQQLNAAEQQIATTLPEKMHLGAVIVPLETQIVEGYQAKLWLSLAGAATVFLMICANMATALLARSTERQREMAIRQSLGAGRLHIYRSLMFETLLLTMAGGVVGILLGFLGLRLMVAFAPPGLPRLEHGPTTLALGAAALFLSCITSIFLIAIQGTYLTRQLPSQVLRGGSVSNTLPKWLQAQGFLVVIQVAVSAAFLVIIGLLTHTYINLLGANEAFNTSNLLTLDVSLPSYRYPNGPARSLFYQRSLDRIAQIPGVVSAALVSTVPLRGEANVDSITLMNEGDPKARRPLINIRYVSKTYFKTMEIPLVSGRAFEQNDSVLSGISQTNTSCATCSVAAQSVVVSKTAAGMLWPSAAALGEIVRVGSSPIDSEVIGVVGDVPSEIDRGPIPIVYIDYGLSGLPDMTFVVRTTATASRVATPLASAIEMVDPGVPVLRIQNMAKIEAEALSTTKYQLQLVFLSGMIAAVVASLGIYGAITFAVARRTKEIGIRLALGSNRLNIFMMILKRGLSLVLLGLAIGEIGGLLGARYLRGSIFGIGTLDGSTIFIVAVGELVLAAIASIIPALRASRMDPLTLIRAE